MTNPSTATNSQSDSNDVHDASRAPGWFGCAALPGLVADWLGARPGRARRLFAATGRRAQPNGAERFHRASGCRFLVVGGDRRCTKQPTRTDQRGASGVRLGRVVRATTCVVLGGFALSACGSGGVEPVAIVGVEAAPFDRPLRSYEVSPDGRYVAAGSGDGLCLMETARLAEPDTDVTDGVCVEGNIAEARWSPDSTRVVYGPGVFIDRIEDGPIGVFDVEGINTTVAEPPSGEESGGFFHPTWVDDTTVLFGRIIDSERTFEVVSIDVDSGDDQVIDGLPAPDDDSGGVHPRSYWTVEGDELLGAFAAVGDLDAAELWALPLDGGGAARLGGVPPPGEDDRPIILSPYVRAGRYLLLLDIGVMRLETEPGAPWWWLVDLDDGEDSVAVPITLDIEDQRVVSAALSPDGATLAVHTVELADNEGAEVLAAPTAAVLDGTAQWNGIELTATTKDVLGLGMPASALVWDKTDHLLLEARGAVHRFELE